MLLSWFVFGGLVSQQQLLVHIRFLPRRLALFDKNIVNERSLEGP
jgi:hypothetical protein